MKCIDVKENLGAFIDDEVGISPVGEIEEHMASCVSCRTEGENLRTVSQGIRQIPRISAPAMLDRKVILAYQAFHDAKQRTVGAAEKPTVGWFGIPRFVFAATLAFVVLTAVSAYQIGRISASENAVAARQTQGEQSLPATDFANNNPAKIVEVPVIQEKIVRVPVTTEKIITKTIFVEKKRENTVPKKNTLALKSSVENNGYLTTTNLKGFQPVSELKVTISKKENGNEK